MSPFIRTAAVAAATLLAAPAALAQYGAFGGHSCGGFNPHGPPGFNPLPPGFNSSAYRPGGFHQTSNLYGSPGVGVSHPSTPFGGPGGCGTITGNPHVDAVLQGHGIGARPGLPTSPSDPMRYAPASHQVPPARAGLPNIPRVETPRPVVAPAPVVIPAPPRSNPVDGEGVDASFVAAVAVVAVGVCVHLATARK